MARISQLLKDTTLTWKAVHIAGTNGKGSVAAYLSALLQNGGISTGRFTSPHLIDRWDCITINEKTISESVFHDIERDVKARDDELKIGATEFELLTATAFEVLKREIVSVGVVEAGLGGGVDATNVLNGADVLVAVITRIGLDHQAQLGDTLGAIATEKAGIMKSGVPCVVDGSNEAKVIETLRECAVRAESKLSIAHNDSSSTTRNMIEPIARQLDAELHQKSNLLLAVEVLEQVRLHMPLKKPTVELLQHVQDIKWPGRLQDLSIAKLTGRNEPVLLDGAHNAQAADVLSVHVGRKWRKPEKPTTWILAMSRGKAIQEMVQRLVKRGDNVIATQFGPVDGMPWVMSIPAEKILSAGCGIDGVGSVLQADSPRDVQGALMLGTEVADGGPLVIAGSLYLVSDVLRLLRDL